MSMLKVYVSKEQEKAIREYAIADDRSISNCLLHAMSVQVARSKKKRPNDTIIEMPGKVSR